MDRGTVARYTSKAAGRAPGGRPLCRAVGGARPAVVPGALDLRLLHQLTDGHPI